MINQIIIILSTAQSHPFEAVAMCLIVAAFLLALTSTGLDIRNTK